MIIFGGGVLEAAYFEEIIEACKKSANKIKDIDRNSLPDSKGIVAIFKNTESVSFEENEIEKKGVDVYTLDRYQSMNPIEVLYIKSVNNIRNEFVTFLNVSSSENTYPKIIFSKIKNNHNLKLGYFYDGKKLENGLLMKSVIKKYQTKPIMNKRFGSNDAIPSWNGFNFQGFVTILRTLQLMNTEQKINYGDFAVELERYEDFIIYKCNEAKELFQVKAYVAEKKVTNYAEAFEKLLIHRKQINSPDATCYIATAEKITNWDQSNYKDTITRYGYKDENHIVMEDIIDNIFEELKVYYKNTDEDEEDANLLELAFSSLGRYISERIIYLHLKKDATDDEYRISFEKIAELLDNASKNIEDAHLYYTRVKIDQEVFATVDAGIYDYCDNCDDETCEECPINNFREVFESVDRGKYAQVITSREIIDENEIYKAFAFNPNDLFDLFEDFYHTDLDHFFYDNQHIFIVNTTTNELYMDKIIPTTLKINDPRKTGKGVTKLLKNIQNRTELHAVFNNSSLTTTMKEKSINYKDQQVTFIKEELLDGDLKDNSESSISVDFDFNLINRNFYRGDMTRGE